MIQGISGRRRGAGLGLRHLGPRQAAPSPAPTAAPITPRARPRSLVGLALLSLWLGAIPAGGKAIPYMFEEVVRRRGWLDAEQFTEGQLLARLLPGSSGPNMWVFVIQTLRGPLAGLYCLVLFLLPGAVTMLALTLFILGAARPPWLDGAIHGVSAATIGLLIVWTLQMVPIGCQARLWPVFVLLAFVGNGLLHASLALVLLVLGPLALVCNRPKD